VDNPDGVGEVGNVKCGDALRLTFKLDENKRIIEIKFKTFGCGSAIASSSILTELCKGKTVEEAEQITNKMIADELGGLPPAKMHCSVMGQEALEAAISFYRNGGKKTDKEKEGKVVCNCFMVTDKEIEDAIRHNDLKTVEDVINYTKAGGGCGGCIPDIEAILNSVQGVSEQEAHAAVEQPPRMTNLQKIKLIEEVIDQQVRPVLQKDKGDCELVDVDGNTVYIRFTGHCAGCAFSGMTQVAIVEDSLRKRVHPDISVKQA
jgi:NifU-like protein